MLSELRLLAGGVQIGSTSRGTCPFCAGGSTGETSFALTRLDAVVCKYYCHRATCGAHGTLSGTSCFASGMGSESTRVNNTDNSYTGEIQRLGDEWLSLLHSRYGLSSEQVLDRFGWAEEVGSGRLVVYIRSPEGIERGVHTRAIEGSGRTPKTLDYRSDPTGTWLGWMGLGPPPRDGGGENQGPIVAVEDVISAAKVAQTGFSCVALMGTSLTPDKLIEILSCAKGGKVVLALDRDATDKAIEFSSRYSFLTEGNLIPLLLRKDLKYYTEDEIRKMIYDVTD